MSDIASKASSRRAWWRVPLRVLLILILATVVGWTLKRMAKSMERDPHPAGFRRGLVQGALMPMALPNLIVGNNVAIYSQNNTGLTYKLGYTAGVNACGAVFFGLFFWRVNRWRREMNNNRCD